MKTFSLPAGTVVHVAGLPFRLIEKSVFEGHEANVEIATRELSPFEPDTKHLTSIEERGNGQSK